MSSMKSRKPQKTSKRPRGRDEVVQAICQATADLFAERGPASVSGRQIAERAGVNYGLIHRHFGNRKELQRVVMERLAADLAGAFSQGLSAGRSPIDILAEYPTYWQALARAALDGEDLATLQEEHPVIEAILSLLRDGSPEAEVSQADRMSIAIVAASLLGWAVFGPFLRSALEIEGVPDAEMNTALDLALVRVLQSNGQ
jgi:AcrR family transcriptional regulator